MQQDVEKVLVRDKQAHMNIVGGEYVLWPAAAEAPILIDNTQLQQRVLSTSSDVTVGLLLGSSYRRLDKSANPQLLQVLDATAYVVHQDEKGNVSKMGLAVADGAGGHYGDAQQDQQIATVAKRCCELALKQLTTYSDVELCYQALPSIVKTIAKDIQDERLTESCSLSALVAFVGKKHLRVVGFGIGDCLLAAIDPQKGTIETLCPAHESRHGSAMYPASYKEFEVRYFQKRLSKDCMLLGMSDGLWAGLPHLKTTAKYDNGLEYEAIQLDTNAINIHLHPSKTLAKGALCYDALTQLAIQNLNTQRQTVKAQWEQAVTQKAALPSVHYGDDGVLHMLQIEPNIYSLQFFNNSSLIPDALKTLNQPETQQDSYAWQNQLFALLKKEPLGSLAWCYGLCLLSHKVMQKASRDRLQESYINGMKYATAALKNARCLTGQLLAKTQIQEILKVYINKELALKSDYPLTKAFTWQHQLIAHRQLLQQKLSLLRKDSMSELLNYHQQFLNNFIHVQWQSIQQQAGINFDHQISLVSLGSLGRGEAAPYSDFEFAWLVDDKFTQEKRSLLEKLTEWWFLQVITLGETKTIIAEISKKPLVESGFTFDMDLGGLCPLMERQLINTPQGLAQLQENADEATFILRNALISCGYVTVSKKLFEQYQLLLFNKLNENSEKVKSINKSLLSKKLKHGEVYGKVMLSAALRDFSPSSVNEDKERRQTLGFDVKKEIYRLPSQVLTGLCWYYHYYQPGAAAQLAWLDQHKKLHPDGLKYSQQLFNAALQWRYRTQLYYGYEHEVLYYAHNNEQYNFNECKYILTHQEIKNIQELYRILLPLEQITREFLKCKAEGKSSQAFRSNSFYNQEANTLAIAQARTGDYQAAEQYYAQAIALKPNDKYLFLQRLQNLGQHYEQIRTYLREQAYQENSVAKKAYETQLEQLKDKAINILQLLLNLLCKDKNIVTSLEEAYQQIPLMFRESFRVALLKVMDKKPEFSSELQASFKVLHRYPDVAGERLQWLTQKNHWQQLLMQCIDEKQPAQFQGQSIILSSSLLGRKFLSSQIAAQLLDNGEIKKQTISRSSHTVIRIKLNEEIALYAKVFPEMPGMTYLIEQLHSRLIGHGVSLSELVKIEVPHKGMIPLILSQEVMGPTFDEVLRGDAAALARVNASSTEEALLRLDKHHMMGLMLVAMLTNPEDGIPANFIYHLLPNGQATLVSVDHDHALFPAYLGEELQVKTILFCLPLLKEALPESLKKELLAIDPGSVLRAVLRGAQQQNKSYGSLFSEEEMKKWHQQRKGGTTTIPIPIKKGDATKLYFKLLKLQTLLKEKPQITGLKCLLSLEPRIGSVYAKALAEDKTPQQRLQEIGRYTADKKGSLISQTAAIKTLQLASTLMTQPEYAQLADLSPEEGLAELDLIAYQSELVAEIQQEVQQGNLKRFQQILNSYHQAQVISGDSRKRLLPLNWAKLSIEQQRNLLDICKGISFEQLDLSGCIALTDARLQILLIQSPDLVSLTLSEYKGFGEKTLRAIATYCPSLNRLSLVNFPTWTGEEVKKVIMFSALTDLQLSNCSYLNTISFESSQLNKLNVINCSKLNTDQLSAGLRTYPLLSHIHVEQCALIKPRLLGLNFFRARGFTDITLPLAYLLISDQCLDLSGLKVEIEIIMKILTTFPRVESIIYPQISSKELNKLVSYSLDKDLKLTSIHQKNYSLPPSSFHQLDSFFSNKFLPKPPTMEKLGFLKSAGEPVDGHFEVVQALSDGRLVTGSYDGIIRIWNLSQDSRLECVRTLSGHNNIIEIVKILQYDQILSSSRDGVIKLWDLKQPTDQECIKTLNVSNNSIDKIKVLPNSLIIIYCKDKTPKVWDLKRPIDQELINIVNIYKIHVLIDSRFVSISDEKHNRFISIWDFSLQAGQECVKTIKYDKDISYIYELTDGKLVLISSEFIEVLDIKQPPGQECIKNIKYDKRISLVHKLADDRLIVNSNEYIDLVDISQPTGKEYIKTIKHDKDIRFLYELPDSRLLLISDKCFEVLDLKQFPIQKHVQKLDYNMIVSSVLLPDSQIIISDSDGIKVLDFRRSKSQPKVYTIYEKSYDETTGLNKYNCGYIQILLDDRLVCRNGRDIKIWDFTNQQLCFGVLKILKGKVTLKFLNEGIELIYSTKIGQLEKKQLISILTDCLYSNTKDFEIKVWSENSLIFTAYSPSAFYSILDLISILKPISSDGIPSIPRDIMDDELVEWLQRFPSSQPNFNMKQHPYLTQRSIYILLIEVLSIKILYLTGYYRQNFLYENNNMINSAQLLADGRVVIGTGCILTICDTKLSRSRIRVKILEEHLYSIKDIRILADGRLLSTSLDKTIKIWDLSKDKGQNCVRTIKENVTVIQILKNNLIIGVSQDYFIKVWDLNRQPGQEYIRTLSGHKGIVTLLQVLANQIVVSVASDDTLKVWDLNKSSGEECIQTLYGFNHNIHALLVLKNGWIVSGSADNTLIIWDLKQSPKNECLKKLDYKYRDKNSVISLYELDDGRIVSQHDKYRLEVWDLNCEKGSENIYGLGTDTSDSGENNVTSITVLPNCLVFRGTENGIIEVWHLNSEEGPRCIQTLNSHDCKITFISALSDGRVISGSVDAMINFWNLWPEIHLDNLAKLAIASDYKILSTNNYLQYHINNEIVSKIDLQAAFETLRYLVSVIVDISILNIELDTDNRLITFHYQNNSQKREILKIFEAIKIRLQRTADLKIFSLQPNPDIRDSSAVAPTLVKHSALWKAPPQNSTSIDIDNNKDQLTEQVTLPSSLKTQP